MSDKALLLVHGAGEIPAKYAARVLSCMSNAYDGLWILDRIRIANIATIRAAVPIVRQYWSDDAPRLAFPELKRSLELKRVVLQSPGFWEFLGTLNPLEALRKYLTDRHERDKDRKYRNKAEAVKLELENKILETKLVSDTIDALRKASISDGDIAALIRDLIILPTYQLQSLQDRNVIAYAEITYLTNKTSSAETDA